ncbi:MAG TPA: c-type cytochrome domain-containing protein [Opitutales bacterium]|nr:c-type cytochrome domain-containing protein [Opitutales bacterium]
MTYKISAFVAGSAAGLALLLTALNAADAPAPAAASASASGSAVASAKTGTGAPAAANAPAKPDLSKLPKASDKKGLTFDKDILPMFKASCSGCHIDSARPSGGLDLSTLASTLKGGRGNKDKDVVPGHGDQSFVLLYTADAVAKAEMPPLNRRTQHPALTKEQLADLRAWIDQGAK